MSHRIRSGRGDRRRRCRVSRGLTRVEVVVLLVLALLVGGVSLPSCGLVNARQNMEDCQKNMAELGTAMFKYANRSNGRFPGYINLLKTQSMQPYVDPDTKQPTPVSWAVELLTDLDRGALYDAWRKDLNSNSGAAPNTKVQIDKFICPADAPNDSQSPHLSYVVNTGMPDIPAALPAKSGANNFTAAAGMPRDWAANGLFFDNYSDDPLLKTTATQRGPMVTMRREMVRDPKDRTILITENIDAGNYVLAPAGAGPGMWRGAEAQLGAGYQLGAVKGTNPPVMTPPSPALEINADAGKGDGLNMNYCRPSSNHRGGVNVLFVSGTGMFLNEKISYLVLAKLMSSEDGQMKIPGTQTLADPIVRQYQMSDAEIKP